MSIREIVVRRFYVSVLLGLLMITILAAGIIIPVFGAWWNPEWRYRKTITIDHTKVAADLTNFPLLIDLVDADLASKAKGDGSDIAFVDTSGQLKHEIEYYNTGTGHLLAWVRLTSLSSTADQMLYMYYGNPSASSQQSPPEVWDSNYKMVQHFEETSGTHYDSTANGRNGTAYGGVVQGTTGKIDGADSFDGSDDYIGITGQDVVVGASSTVSFWEKNMKRGSGTTNYGTIFDDWSVSSGFLWQFGDLDSTFQIGNVADWNNRLTYAHGGLMDNQWHCFVATLAGGTITLYMDGASVATKSSSTTIASDGEAVYLMRRTDGHYTTGLMDELEVSNTARSAEWVTTSYNSQNNPSSFYSVGAEEGKGPVVFNPSPPEGATGVSVSLSQLSFDLTFGAPMNYYVRTYPNIGSGSGTNVGNGSYTVSVSGLEHFTTYAWHVNATDGTNWTNKTYTFSTSGLSNFNPANEGWLYRKKISADHTKVAADLTNFPMLIDVTDSDLASHARADGRDILFMDGSGMASKLSHEIERYSGGHLTAWVRLPSLSSTTDTEICLYYGKPAASQQEDATGVWGSNFKMVQHLEETSGAVLDSTSNGISGSPVGGVTQNTNGKINGACYFDGTNDHIDFGDSLDITEGGATWSLWVKLDETRIHRLMGKGSNGILIQWYYGGPIPAGVLEIGNVADWNNRASYTIAQNTSWHYVVGVFDDAVSKYKIYLDGALLAEGTSVSSLPANNGESYVVGTGYVHDFFTKGTIDEVCVSSVARSAAWIRTCYNNQYTPSTFYDMGVEESAGAPVVSDPSPADGAVNVPVSLSQLSFRLTDYQSNLMNYTVSTFPNIGSGSGTNVGNGVYTVPASGLIYSTVYTWQVRVTDGTSWTNETYSFSTQSASMFDPSTQGWQYRRKIVIDHTRVYGNLMSFTLLINMTDSSLGSHARTDGHDILFMNAPGTASKLDHEIELYSSGQLTAWIRVPNLSNTTDTEIYMYYGKLTATSQENAAGVWDSDFRMVQHFNETSGTVGDSTSNGINGIPTGGVTQNAEGKISRAAWFNGVNGYVNFGDVLDITTGGAAWSAWIKFDEAKVHRFIGKGEFGILVQWFRDVEGVCELQAGNIGDWSNRAVYQHAQDTNWHYVAAVFDNATNKYKLYLDGILVTEGPASSLPTDNNADFVIGSGWTNAADGFTKGTIDEVQVSSTARSSAWIRTCYNNQYSPSSFYIMGNEEGAGAPAISDPSPADGAVNVPVSLSQLSFRLTDYQSNLMNYTVSTFPNIGSGSGTNVGNGVYTVPVTGLSQAVTYTWYVSATDGIYSASSAYSFTTRPTIMLSDPSPPEGGIRVSLNPRLSITVNHELNYPMNVTFSTNATGEWHNIITYNNVENGIYTAIPEGVTKRATKYYWSVYANDAYGHSTLRNYTLILVNYVGEQFTPIGNSFCCRFGYIRPAREEGQFIATWQHSEVPAPGTLHDNAEYAVYDIEQGWIKTWAPVFEDGTGSVYHNFWGYWDGQYHYLDGMGGTTFEVADSTDWEGFRSMNFSIDSYQVGPRTWTNPTASTYSFNNTNAWIIASDYYDSQWAIKYWPWSKSSGWGTPVPILATLTTNVLDAGQLLQLTRTNWLLYYADVAAVQIKYVQTTDGGQTWTGPYTRPELTTTSSQCNRISFARYGDNFYAFLTDSNGNPTIYNSTDGINWANKQVVMPVSGIVYHGTLLHQSALISTMSDVGTGDPGLQYGIITIVPEMLSNPSTPSDPYPGSGAVLPRGTTTTTLEVTVHGSQTYNVAFYWANGTFIGEDRLLREGDRAHLHVSIAGGSAYGWFAISRGATFEYCGNEPMTTSDEEHTSTYTFNINTNEAPTIDSYAPATSTPSVNEGQSLTFTQTSHDPDSDPLSYQWLLNSVLKATTQNWTYNPSYADAGIYNVSVIVSDGSLSTKHEWAVTVIDVEPPTPGLSIDPQSVTCRKYLESFDLQIKITQAASIDDFEFEIHYNTTLLNYTSVTWNAWGTGTINVNEATGTIIGSTSGNTRTGDFTLATIAFRVALHHLWKSIPGWNNNQTGSIYFQWANVSYPGIPDRGYVKGGLNQINVGPDVAYRFSPIQGDVNNDGKVDIFDLGTIAHCYNAKPGDPIWPQASIYDLNGDNYIDIFDLVIVARNFGFTYP